MSPRRSSLSRNQKLTLIIAVLAIIVTIVSAFVSGHDWFGLTRRTQIAESRGRVIDIISQEPISGAKVTLDLDVSPLIEYTDSEGYYILKIVIDAKTSGQIRVDAQGYEVYTRYITIYPELGTVEDIRLTQLHTAIILPTNTAEPPTVTLSPIANLTLTALPPEVPGKTFAITSSEISQVILRRSPGYINKDISTDIIAEIDSGEIVEILGESQNADGLLWWKVSWKGHIGWIAEHTGTGRAILMFDW